MSEPRHHLSLRQASACSREAKTSASKIWPRDSLGREPDGQHFTYLSGAKIETSGMPTEIVRRTRACWSRIRRYLCEIYDRPKVAFLLKTRIVKIEAIEPHLNGYSAWILPREQYSNFHTLHLRILLRIMVDQRKIPDYRMTLYDPALEITAFESIEPTLRTRRLLWAGTHIQ